MIFIGSHGTEYVFAHIVTIRVRIGNNFSQVCLCVCVSICLSVQVITFEML